MGWLRKICVYLGETTSLTEEKRGRTGLSSSSLVESLASRPTQLLLARTDLNCQGRHPLPRSSSVLMSDGENLAAIWVFAAESGWPRSSTQH